MAFRAFRSQSVSTQGAYNLAHKTTEEHVPSKVAQSTVACFYKAIVAGFWRNVSVLWCKNLMNHTLHVMVDSVGDDSQFSCKIDVKPWPFWSKKGYKTFEVEGNHVEVYWHLRNAKFTVVVLLLGDYKKKAYKRTKSRPALVEAMLLLKKENIFGKKSFSTKARFDEKLENKYYIFIRSKHTTNSKGVNC
ncbi:hypothetical protein MtrunA17_Chr5g0429401 [Medicago truncatula]|uniref:Uncharacterized protein n=1 Tax=Medicago truncatula TaxID=3880 RepID=A0A396HSV8_MEDTR|nr:hypothetical protein MtrunA17_Chr5g0429401 [Medicago truncatula]